MKNKGSVWIWLSVLVGIFIVALAYIIFNQVLYSDYGIYALVNASLANTSVNVTSQQKTMQTIKTIWDYWPLIAIIGLIVWGFVASQKREPDTGWQW